MIVTVLMGNYLVSRLVIHAMGKQCRHRPMTIASWLAGKKTPCPQKWVALAEEAGFIFSQKGLFLIFFFSPKPKTLLKGH